MKEHIANVGPVSVCIDASQASFQLYTSGVYSEKNCKKSHFSHAVGCVGYGVDDTLGEAYWIVKNSWSTSWGERGYIRISMGLDTCNIADVVCYSVY